jgi:GNAT superfamily N-acetyltransferase
MIRNIFALDDLVIHPLSPEDVESLPDDFSSDEDLNEFFKVDSLAYERGLWVKNYKILLKDQEEPILGLVSLLNDALRFQVKGQKRKFTHFRKNYMETHPAMKVGRLAIRKELLRAGIGSKALNLIKAFFLNENRTGCRFITVDAYNRPEVIEFYRRNGFVQIKAADSSKPETPATVSMFFPLMELLVDPLV